MSYSVDLWSSYNKVESRLVLNFGFLKEFIELFSQYYTNLTNFTLNLKKIYELKCITSNESLQKGINGFKSDLLNQYLALSDYLTSLKYEIINPLKEYKEKLSDRIKKNLKETSLAEKTYHESAIQMDRKKKEYHKSVKLVENFKIKYELEKNRSDLDLQDYNVTQSDEIQITSSIKASNEMKQTYLEYIDNTNMMQDEYIEIKKRNLNDLQYMEEDLGENIKDCLRKYTIFKMSYLRNLQYDINKKAKIMEEINIRKDIFDYILANETKACPPEKYTFLPYICEIGSKNNSDLPKEIISEVKQFVEGLNKISPLENAKKENLEKIKTFAVNSFFLERNFTQEEKRDIGAYAKQKICRRYFLEELNKLRIKNGLNLNEYSYQNFGDILKIILKQIEKDSDYESIRLIIILATSLYKKVDIEDNPRVFLLDYISDIDIWKQIDFWIKIIQYEINEEMVKHKRIILIKPKKNNQKLEGIKLIVKSILTTYLFHMISFSINDDILTEILSFFQKYYFLDTKTIESLNKIIEKNKFKSENLTEKKDSKEGIIVSETINNIDNNINIEEEVEILKTEGSLKNGTTQKLPHDNYKKSKNRGIDKTIIIKSSSKNSDTDKSSNHKVRNLGSIIQDGYAEEDIISKIAITEHINDKSFDLISIKDSSGLKILKENNNIRK